MKKKFLAVALLSAFATPAFAADTGVYIAGSLGMTSNIKDVDSGMSFGGLVGYQFNKDWAAEGGYISLISKANINGLPAGGKATATLSGTEFAGIYNYQVNEQTSVLLRLGYANTTAKTEATLNGTPLNIADSTLSGILIGVGVQYSLNQQLAIRAGFNSYDLKDSKTGEKPNNFYAAAVYKF